MKKILLLLSFISLFLSSQKKVAPMEETSSESDNDCIVRCIRSEFLPGHTLYDPNQSLYDSALEAIQERFPNAQIDPGSEILDDVPVYVVLFPSVAEKLINSQKLQSILCKYDVPVRQSEVYVVNVDNGFCGCNKLVCSIMPNCCFCGEPTYSLIGFRTIKEQFENAWWQGDCPCCPREEGSSE